MTDERLGYLAGLNELEELNLDGTVITGTGLKTIDALARSGHLTFEERASQPATSPSFGGGAPI